MPRFERVDARIDGGCIWDDGVEGCLIVCGGGDLTGEGGAGGCMKSDEGCSVIVSAIPVESGLVVGGKILSVGCWSRGDIIGWWFSGGLVGRSDIGARIDSSVVWGRTSGRCSVRISIAAAGSMSGS